MTPDTLSAWAAHLGLTPRVLHTHPKGIEYVGVVDAPIALPLGEIQLVKNVYAYPGYNALVHLTPQGLATRVYARGYLRAAPYNAEVAQLRRSAGGQER